MSSPSWFGFKRWSAAVVARLWKGAGTLQGTGKTYKLAFRGFGLFDVYNIL